MATKAARALPRWLMHRSSSRPNASAKRNFFTSYSLQAPRRHASTTRHQAGPTMAQLQAMHAKKNQTTINYGISIVIGFIALSYASVPLYRLSNRIWWSASPLCTPHDRPKPGKPSDPSNGRASSSRLFSWIHIRRPPWRFTPQQREVRVHPGETALAFFTATNTSDADIIGVATYSVAPGEVAPYFSKIQCFCFEEQRLNAGETVDMPVFFYIDRAFLEDPNMRGIQDITLNYTFFKAKYDKEGHLRPIPGA